MVRPKSRFPLEFVWEFITVVVNVTGAVVSGAHLKLQVGHQVMVALLGYGPSTHHK